MKSTCIYDSIQLLTLSLSYYYPNNLLLGLMPITDSATANRAKRYVYGLKEQRCKTAVQKRIEEQRCKAAVQNRSVTPETETNTVSYSLPVGFHNTIKITMFVLYLYMVWSYLST